MSNKAGNDNVNESRLQPMVNAINNILSTDEALKRFRGKVIKDIQLEEVSLTKNGYEIGGKVTYEEDEKSNECETCGATPASDFNGQCLCMNCVQNDVFESMNENAD